jgi:hypothetical protein
LQLQNLWAAEVLPAQMPVSFLPLSQYELTTLVALLTVGGAIAGFTVRLCRPVPRRAAAWKAAAGVVTVQGAATGGRWLPAVLVGLALAWCGVRPAARRQIMAGILGPDRGAGPLVTLALAVALAGTGALEMRQRLQAKAQATLPAKE